LLTYTVLGEDKKNLGTVLISEHQASEGKKDYYAMAQGGPTVFLIRDYLLTRLNKQGQDFVEKPTPTPVGATPTIPVFQGGAQPEDEPMGEVEDEPADGGEE